AIRGEVDSETVCGWIDLGGAGGATGRFWTLDPIDGTKGFLRKEQYAIALALIVDGRVEVAALACPNLPVQPGGGAGAVGTLLVAVRGQGTTIQPLDGHGPAALVRVSSCDDPASARF